MHTKMFYILQSKDSDDVIVSKKIPIDKFINSVKEIITREMHVEFTTMSISEVECDWANTGHYLIFNEDGTKATLYEKKIITTLGWIWNGKSVVTREVVEWKLIEWVPSVFKAKSVEESNADVEKEVTETVEGEQKEIAEKDTIPKVVEKEVGEKEVGEKDSVPKDVEVNENVVKDITPTEIVEKEQSVSVGRDENIISALEAIIGEEIKTSTISRTENTFEESLKEVLCVDYSSYDQATDSKY